MKKSSLLLLVFFTSSLLHAQPQSARTVYLSEKQTALVKVPLGRSSILSFPTKPSKVILGSQGAFAVEYVENDLAITALQPSSHSNLFVYLEGRRFGFDLAAVPLNGDEILLVRDSLETRVKVKVRSE